MTAHDLELLIWAALFAAAGYCAWAAVAWLGDRHRTDKTLPIDRAQSRSQLMPPTPYDDYLPPTRGEELADLEALWLRPARRPERRTR